MLRKQSPSRKDEKLTKEPAKVDEKKRKPSLVADRTKTDRADAESTKKDSQAKEARDRQVEKEKPKKMNSTEEPAKPKKAEEKPIPIDVVVKQAELGKIDPFEDRPKIPRTKDESRRDSLPKEKNKDSGSAVGKSEKISEEKIRENSPSKAGGRADANSVRRKTLEKVSGMPPSQKGAIDKSSPLEKKQFSAFAEERKTKMRGDKPADGSPQRKSYGQVGKKQKHDSFSDEDKGGASEKSQRRDSLRARRDQSPEGNLTAHVEVIRERRMSLPRTITTDPAADVEIVIGDDGKPVFQPTLTPKADEILRELTQLVVEDGTGKERVPKLISS